MDTNHTNSTLGLAGLPARVRYGKRDLHTELNDVATALLLLLYYSRSVSFTLSAENCSYERSALFEDRIDVIAGLAHDTSRIVVVFKI